MAITGVLETILYAADLDRAAWFYGEVLGLPIVSEMRPLSLAIRVGAESVLLIFDPTRSSAPGRVVPSHGAEGPGHVAFRIEEPAYDDWLARFGEAGIPIEHEHVWTNRTPGRSIYVRDPAGNSVELITADIWP